MHGITLLLTTLVASAGCAVTIEDPLPGDAQVPTTPCLPETSTAALATPIDIPAATGIALSLPIAGSGNVASLRLSLSISHAFGHDLQISLISPAGTSFALGDGRKRNVEIDDQPIDAFSGQPVAGAWRLVIRDAAAGDRARDAGTIDAWSLAIEGACSPIAP